MISIHSNTFQSDEEFDIRAENLIPFHSYDLELKLNHYYNINAPMTLPLSVPWTSKARFVADKAGTISTSTSPSIDGDYTGISQMGLFFNARPIAKQKASLAPTLADITTQGKFQMDVTIREGHTVIDTNTIQLYHQLPHIHHSDIILENVQLRMFYDSQAGARPTILVLSGSDGRIEKSQNIAQLLANKGFTTVAVAYFGLDGLAKNLNRIPIELVKQTIAAISDSPFVEHNKIGIYGRSKGAELALLAATKFPEIKAIVLNSPSALVYEGGSLSSFQPVVRYQKVFIPKRLGYYK